jgi:pimeloyl-ACP methyl ester carboxylesterase
MVIVGIILLVVVLLLVGSWVNHSTRLKKENQLFKAPGKLVKVNDHNMSVLVSGNEASVVTLVFMAGGGTCSPILDFKSLYCLFAPEYRIVVVEKSGYGFSEDSDSARDIDTMLEETREALRQVGIHGKLVLVPHSMSGIEALHWANRYPEEISAIIGLDPTVPKIHAEQKINIVSVNVAKFFADIGLMRLFPSIVDHAAAIRYGTLSEDDKKLYRVVFYRRTITKSMMSEFKAIKANALEVAHADHTQIPILFFISNGSGTGFAKDLWQSSLTEYVRTKDGRFIILDCFHYVHNIEYRTIFEESSKFLQALR